jgi:hypothetical protein
MFFCDTKHAPEAPNRKLIEFTDRFCKLNFKKPSLIKIRSDDFSCEMPSRARSDPLPHEPCHASHASQAQRPPRTEHKKSAPADRRKSHPMTATPDAAGSLV